MTNRYYKKLDCPNYTEINQDLIDYVHKYTTLLTKSDDYRYCNFPDRFGQSVRHFVNANPKLITWIGSMKLILKDVYITLTWDVRCDEYPESSIPIHVDKPPVYWKINWPIMNMQKTAVRFYEPKDPAVNINTLVKRTGNPNSKDYDHYLFEYKDFNEVDRHDFSNNQPIIMNGQVAHDVGFYPDPVFPRIGMQVMFWKEPTHLL